MFRPLTKDEIETVVELQLGNVQKMLGKNDIRLTATKRPSGSSLPRALTRSSVPGRSNG